MFLKKITETNSELLKICFEYHQKGEILPDTYVIDLDTLKENALKILNEAKRHKIHLYFMLKQIGRNPYIAKELMKLGYEGAVVVDFREAEVMMKYGIPIANVGHLVQAPKALLQQLVAYGCSYFTVFSYEKIVALNACAKALGKNIDLMLKVVGHQDMIYNGQTAGFTLDELPDLIQKVKKLEHVTIKGVTSFPCFLYDESKEKIQPTPNLSTLLTAKQILLNHGVIIDNVNAPSTTSVATLAQMGAYPINSGEPGHGLSGTTPLHAQSACAESPCVVYVSEISHNFRGHSYCYGGGHYRRSHMQHAYVGTSMEDKKQVDVIPPSLESIDYYFEIPESCKVHDTVVMAFRFQIFVTRSQVCLVEGIHSDHPHVVGIYTSQGEPI